MQTLLSTHWHHLPESEVINLLGTDIQNGLDLFEVQHRQNRFGQNILTPSKGKSAILRFLLQFNNPLIYILLASSIITAVIKDPLDALLILAIVIINAFIGFVQETRAEKAIQALTQSMTTETTVIRAGQTQRISSVGLVPGDLVILQAGARVPADLRLVRSRDLQVVEAALTGEAAPVQKSTGVTLPPETGLADRKNMAYTSTLVTYGQGTGVVTATGDETEIGRISKLISSADEIETPLTKKIARFSKLVLYAILALAVITFIVGVLRGQEAIETFSAAVALAVAMIPEGLPAALTLTLAIGVTRMARRQAIIRKLPAVETLGSVTVICSDKTGTLTQNQMTVQEIHAGGRLFRASGVGYSPDGNILFEDHTLTQVDAPPILMETLRAGVLCSDSQLVEKDGQWVAEGDPTEVALIVAAHKLGLLQSDLVQSYSRLDVIPFDAQYQYMASIHNLPESDASRRVIYVKGSVEAILERSNSTWDLDGHVIPIDIDAVHTQVDKMAGNGMRVLALAMLYPEQGKNHLDHQDLQGLMFLGLQGMIDPPRPEAINAVHACQRAGIQVKMITGDHPLTASAIASQIGLAKPCPDGAPARDCVVTGSEIASLSDLELIDTAQKTAVFARVSPEQKLRLVEALQARGQVVAMTGDGVNDGPALKQANIGIAMGITGTEVAKEASDMILTDDNFATIEAAVEEGRGVFDNLTKIIAWTLPTNLGEGLIILVAVLAGIALPILPIHILWINTVTAAVLGLVLALEPKEAGIMQRSPRAPDAPILTRDLLVRIVLLGVIILAGAFGLYEYELSRGLSESQARTIAVNVIVIIEIFYLLNCRSLIRSVFQVGLLSNRWVWWSILTMLVLQALFTYAPFMNKVMSSAPIVAKDWIVIGLIGLISFGVIELEKHWRRKKS